MHGSGGGGGGGGGGSRCRGPSASQLWAAAGRHCWTGGPEERPEACAKEWRVLDLHLASSPRWTVYYGSCGVHAVTGPQAAFQTRIAGRSACTGINSRHQVDPPCFAPHRLQKITVCPAGTHAAGSAPPPSPSALIASGAAPGTGTACQPANASSRCRRRNSSLPWGATAAMMSGGAASSQLPRAKSPRANAVAAPFCIADGGDAATSAGAEAIPPAPGSKAACDPLGCGTAGVDGSGSSDPLMPEESRERSAG